MTGKPDGTYTTVLIDTKCANKNSDIVPIPKLTGKDDIKHQFHNWTLTYSKDARWDIVGTLMKVMQKGHAKSMLNKTPAKLSIRFYEKHKDKHLPNKENLLVPITTPQNGLRYKGLPIKKYDYEIIDPYSQHIEFILTLDCVSYRDAVKLAHKLKRLKTINSVEVQIDTLKFK